MLFAIVEHEGKHAVKAAEAVGSPLSIRREQNFRVRLRPELPAGGFKVAPYPSEVVDLAVEDNPVAGSSADHRLIRGAVEIDDGESGVTKRDVAAVAGP